MAAHNLSHFPPSVCWVGDTVYTPRVTPFIALAQRQGLVSVLGESMWLGQAVASFEIMTGTVLDEASRSEWSQEACRLLVPPAQTGAVAAAAAAIGAGSARVGDTSSTSTCRCTATGHERPDGLIASKL